MRVLHDCIRIEQDGNNGRLVTNIFSLVYTFESLRFGFETNIFQSNRF